jgi:hypothetical protein
MRNLKLKPQLSGVARALWQASRAALSTYKRWLAYLEEVKTAPMVTQVAVLLEKLTGVVLGGIAVSVQIGNVLVCVSVLMLGPAFVLGLLPN